MTNGNLTAAQQQIINDSLSAIEQVLYLLELIGEHLGSDPDTSNLGCAIDGVASIAKRARALGELSA